MSVNKVILLGYVGSEPVIKALGKVENGQEVRVAEIRVATTENRKNASGEWESSTEWHTVIAWRQLAEVIDKYVKKGSQLYVEGRIKTRSWDGKDGQKHYRTDIMADKIELCSRRNGSESNETPQTGNYSTASKTSQYRPANEDLAGRDFPTVNNNQTGDNGEDDLPF